MCPHCNMPVHRYETMLPIKTICGRCKKHIRFIRDRFVTQEEWLQIKRSIILGRCGGSFEAINGDPASSVTIKCKRCGDTQEITGKEFVFGKHEKISCEKVHTY